MNYYLCGGLFVLVALFVAVIWRANIIYYRRQRIERQLRAKMTPDQRREAAEEDFIDRQW